MGLKHYNTKGRNSIKIMLHFKEMTYLEKFKIDLVSMKPSIRYCEQNQNYDLGNCQHTEIFHFHLL